ncbi:unnamed protein product [Mytilus edulis]|uniref:Uncharacterized protein n=1 Tax=Mytilus edulis TaxID=6550 RepID=A0A8S3RGG2_MYTED|nr:unnamed protein product [Mytilus edulis]
MSSKEGLERYKQEKLQKRREQRLESYYRNRNLKENEYALSDEAVRQRQHREKQEKEQMRRVKETERKRKYRKRKREENINDQRQNEDLNMRNTFENRTEKHRALKKLKLALPKSPDRRVTTMVAYLQNSNSPTVRKLQSSEVISSPEEIEEHKTSKALTEDLKTVIDNCKRKRSDDSLKTMNVIISSVSGEKISDNKCRKKLARKLGLPVRRVSRGHAIRTRILKSEKSSWTYTNRKTRSDAITPDTKKRIYEFWCKPGISRPTGNKADIKRVRIGPKTYSSHMTHILEKTQTDVYLDFIGENPSIKIAQRMFERCKPYFVRPVRPKDRQTCCCKYHVEFKTVFKSCMEFRKKLLIENEPNECYSTPVYDSISDVVNATLCEKVDGSHNLQCLKRNCSDCGVKILNFLPCELDVSDTAEFVKWELVKKESQVGELFSYFRKLIETFPVHQHRATWQNEQFQNLVRNLPEKQCVCVHDFSENYRCSELTEIQSAYFQKTEVSSMLLFYIDMHC